jgi:hypothetical protein
MLYDKLTLFLVKPLFSEIPGKNKPHIRIPAAFQGSGGDKPGSKNSFNVKAFGMHLMRCILAVFWQSKRYLSVFSTRTEKRGFAGFCGIGLTIRQGIGARMGRILLLRTSRENK